MRAGKLDRRLRIEAATSGHDGYNSVLTWEKLTDVWAQYIPSAGKEAREQLGQEATLPATFVIRYSGQVLPLLDDVAKYRLRFPAADDGRVYDLKSAVNVDRRATIHLTAIAGDE